MEKSWAKRSFATAKLAAQAVGEVAKHNAGLFRTQAPNDDFAKAIVAQLSQYKGLMLKIGQVTSYMDLSLPEYTRSILSALQDSIVPLPYLEMNRTE